MPNTLTNKIQEIDEKFKKITNSYIALEESGYIPKGSVSEVVNFDEIESLLHTSSIDLIRAVIELVEGMKKYGSVFDLMTEIRQEEIEQGHVATADRGVGYNKALTDLITTLTESIALGDNTKNI